VEKVTVFLIEYVKAFKAAGANALFMAEPTAGLLSPKMLGRFSSPFVKRIVDAVQDDSFGIILHNCGAKVAHLPAILQSGATAHHFGKPMDLAAAAKQVPADVVVCGNLDPSGVFVGCSPEAITAQTKELCASVKDCRNVVLSSGCDLQSNTPVENIQAFMRAVS
jgi:uroporphyrinogen decarboxylase